jgi:hypothetical protein
MPTALHRLSATEVLKLLKDDKFNVVTYARDLLDRIDNRESVAKAWTYLGEISYKPLRHTIFTVLKTQNSF